MNQKYNPLKHDEYGGSCLNKDIENILLYNPDIKKAYVDLLQFLNDKFSEDEKLQQIYIDCFERGILESNNKEILVTGNKVRIRKAQLSDADFISKTEQNTDNSPWVANWPLFFRIVKFGDDDFLQTIIETNDGTPVGFIIFRDMLNKSTQIELKRIAISDKGKGYGKEALQLSWRLAFEIYNTGKLYLHTKTENIRAQSIYKHVGFIAETPDPCTSFYLDANNYEMIKQVKADE